jgi:hypothetical protein
MRPIVMPTVGVKRNMLMRRVGSMMILRENQLDPLESEWDEFLGFLSTNSGDLGTIRMLVRTDGGVANAGQRKRLAQVLGKNNPLVAVVSDAMKVRFAGATIALFQANYRQYTTKELLQAYDHLGLDREQRRIADTTLKELEAILYAAQ